MTGLDEKCDKLLEKSENFVQKTSNCDGDAYTTSREAFALENKNFKTQTTKIDSGPSELNPRATPYNYQPSTLSSSNEPRNIHATSAPIIQYNDPSPKLSLENFDGDILKYHTFKRKFKSCIEAVYQDFNIRMSFLEETCVGKAREVISGLSCFDDRRHAYDLSWERLDKRFGD